MFIIFTDQLIAAANFAWIFTCFIGSIVCWQYAGKLQKDRHPDYVGYYGASMMMLFETLHRGYWAPWRIMREYGKCLTDTPVKEVCDIAKNYGEYSLITFYPILGITLSAFLVITPMMSRVLGKAWYLLGAAGWVLVWVFSFLTAKEYNTFGSFFVELLG